MKYATKNVGVSQLDSPEFSERYKQELLITFKDLIEYLEANHYRWWVGYGTAIGAVRHHGLIPWDDDIDIMMPRQDYEQLLASRENLSNTHNRIICTYDSNYHTTFAKFYSIRNTIWEAPQFKYITGAFVDIFPMDLLNIDEVDSISKQYLHNCKIFKANTVTLNCETFREFIRRGQYKTIIALLLYKTQRMLTIDCEKKFIASQQVLNNMANGQKYVVLGSSSPKGFDASDFEEDVWLPFEDFSVRMPMGYQKVLTEMYGDYMTPPPVEQRVPIHIFHYINLNEGLTLEEVKERVKQGERCVF